jgi:hypothetical protein
MSCSHLNETNCQFMTFLQNQYNVFFGLFHDFNYYKLIKFIIIAKELYTSVILFELNET